MTPSTCPAATCLPTQRRKSGNQFGISPAVVAFVMLAVIMAALLSSVTVVGMADDNFTDIFYTNSFRGAFNWIKKLDWVGMIVQMVISCFSLFGVALMTIRVLTSMLYLSSKGLWEEVHDLKDTSESEIYDFGLVNMAKSWMKGKGGTGLDAIIGAVLIMLPDVKKYSDFGEKAGNKFEEDITITQYMLKIALPCIMTTFFFAMGFNGTLFEFLAVTVDAMGTAADKAISVNYAGLIDDLVNSNLGYKFAFNANGTYLGEFQQKIAKDIYGRVVSEMNAADADQLYQAGQTVEAIVKEEISCANIADGGISAVRNDKGEVTSTNIAISTVIRNGLAGKNSDGNPVEGINADNYIPYLGYEIVINGAPEALGEFACYRLNSTAPDGEKENGIVNRISDKVDHSLLKGVERVQLASTQEKYLHLFIRQSTSFNGTYFNVDGARNNTNVSTTTNEY